MSTTFKPLYGSNNQAIACTLTGLGNASKRCSAAVDNTANLYQEALVFLKIKTGASGVSSTGTINVYAYGTADGGATYSDNMPGTDSGVATTSPPNLRLIGVVNAVASATTYDGGPFPVSPAFGGVLPALWGLVVDNETGAAFDAGVASAWYQGVQGQGV